MFELTMLIEKLETYSNDLITFISNGWIPDPVLMPTGRPNICEGLGMTYHLVKGSDEEITAYVKRMSPGSYRPVEEPRPTDDAFRDHVDKITVKLSSAPGGEYAKLKESGWVEIDFNKTTREAILVKLRPAEASMAASEPPTPPQA